LRSSPSPPLLPPSPPRRSSDLVDRSDLTRGHVAVTGPGWQAAQLIDVAAELLPTARKPLASRTRVRVHLGTAEVLARAVQTCTRSEEHTSELQSRRELLCRLPL